MDWSQSFSNINKQARGNHIKRAAVVLMGFTRTQTFNLTAVRDVVNKLRVK